MKKAVILLGAGFALPWGGPSSNNLHRRLLSCPYNGCHSLSDTIERCLEKYYGEQNCNFETYIACLESLQNYIYSKTTNGKSPNFTSLTPALYEINQDILDAIKTGSEKEGITKREYIGKVWRHNISTIINAICLYDNPENIKKRHSLNENLITFVNSLLQQGYAVKFYTTNYDRLIPYIFQGEDINEALEILMPQNDREEFDFGTNTSSIEDFGKLEMDSDTSVISLSPKPINFNYDLSEFCSSKFSHFNLHGSRYIELSRSIPYVPVFSPSGNCFGSEMSINIEGGNPNDNLLFSPIIVGYSKTQRVFTEPFNFGFTAFALDCDTCDKFFSFGYSFNDPHINNIIQTHLKTGSELECVVKDNFIPHISTPKRLEHTHKNESGFWKSKDGRTRIFCGGIEKYLSAASLAM